MSCVMRAGGATFDVDAFCLATALPVLAKHHAGEPRRPGAAPRTRSSVNIRVSDADFDGLGRQIQDAIGFLERYADEVRRLMDFPGVESVELDFAVRRRDVPGQSDSFPPRLVSLAGSLGLWLTISHYEISDPE